MRPVRKEPPLTLQLEVCPVARVVGAGLLACQDSLLQLVRDRATAWCRHDLEELLEVFVEEPVRAAEEDLVLARVLVIIRTGMQALFEITDVEREEQGSTRLHPRCGCSKGRGR